MRVNVPSAFQALIIDVLRDLFRKFAVAYIDELLIFSNSAHPAHQNGVTTIDPEHLMEKCGFTVAALQH